MVQAPRAAQATGATWTERKTRPCPVTTTSASGNQEKSAPHHAQEDDPRRNHEIKNRKQAREMTQQVKCLPLKHRGQTLDPSTHVTPVPSRQRRGAPGWIPAISDLVTNPVTRTGDRTVPGSSGVGTLKPRGSVSSTALECSRVFPNTICLSEQSAK